MGLLSLTSFAQVKFEAKVSKDHMGINERLRVDFEMNEDGDNFKQPSFEDFRVVGGPNQSISNSWINGKRTFSKTYSYFLSPLKKGRLTIGQATIEIDGQVYKTSPIQVEVTEAVAVPTDGNNTELIADESVHLVAEISKTNPFINEGITVTYKLYVSHNVGVSNWRELDSPKYSDFWSQNIEYTEYKQGEEKYKGREYRYVVLRSTVLYPQKSGELEIEPLTLDVAIEVPGSKRDFFGRRISERVNKTISAGKRTIQVKPLPTIGRPDNYNGAVGNFNLDVKTNKDKLNANESLQLDIEISGKGNLKLFSIPSIKLPSALEVYEPEISENINTDLGGMRGSIRNSYTIVPQFKGNYPIPAFKFSYFDPITEQYKTLTSPEQMIEVEGGPVSASSASPANNHKQQVVLSDDNFKYIKLNADLKPVHTDAFFKSPLFWSLLGGPFLLIPIFIVAGKKRRNRLEDVEGNKLRQANKLAKKYLSEARKNMDNPDAFYESLERALHNYLRAKLNIETSEMEKSLISGMLKERKVSDGTVEEFINLLKSCEFARYASVSKGSVAEDYDKAVANISEIDKQIQ